MIKKGFSLAVLSAAHAINHIYQLILPVVMPKIVVDYNLSYFSIGILIACYQLPFSLLQIIFGSLSRSKSRRLLCLGLVLNSAAFLAIAFPINLSWLAILLLLAGIGGSTYHPIGIPLISELFLERRGQALGFHQTGGAIGSFLAPLAIGALAELLGWRSSFLVMASLGFILFPVLWINFKKPIQFESRKGGGIILVIRQAFLLILATTIGLLGLRGLTPFATEYFFTGKGTSYSQAIMLFSLLQIAGIFSGPICGRLSDVFGRKKVISILIIIEAISLFFITIFQNTLLAFACVIFGFTTFGLLATTDALFSDTTSPEFLGTVIGLNLSVSFGMSVILPPLLGRMIDSYGFGYSFTTLSVLIPISIVPLIKTKTAKEKT